MRLGAWCWLCAGFWLSACAGDYPLEPTICDRYCHVTRDLQCGGPFYDPAGCVSRCESELKGDLACREEMNGVLACFEEKGVALKRCLAYSTYPPNFEDAMLCEARLGELDICSSTLRVARERD